MSNNSNGEIYFSVDVESDGPIPGENSMLSLGAAAFVLPSEEPIDTFSRNLIRLEGAKEDPSTMEWWKSQPEAWEATRQNMMLPEHAMKQFVRWVKTAANGMTPVFVGYPTGYDFTFMYWYMIKFAGESPFSFSCLDLKTLAMAVLNLDYRRSTKRNMPKEWFKGTHKHTHKAVEDAIGQGQLFCRIMAAMKKLHED